MITLFHGDDSVLSRNAFLKLRRETENAVTLEGNALSLTDLTQVFSGSDLFGTQKDIFISELLSKRKPSKELDAIAETLRNTDANVYLWEIKELTTKQLSLIKGAKVNLFKIPATIFSFLDNFRPNNAKQLIELFHKTLLEKDAEFVIFMLTRHVRTLLALSARSLEQNVESHRHPGLDSGSQISEVSRMAPWQKGKMEKQAQLFTTKQLLFFHSRLFEIDLAQKTGDLTSSLSDTIDFFLLSV